MNKNRLLWLDIVRIIACFFVCIVHSPIPSGKSDIFLSAFNYLCSPCNALFFMLSGALLFPVKITSIKKRMIRIGIPVLFWSLISMATLYYTGKLSPDQIFFKLLWIPLAPAHGVYWFLYVIMGLYIMSIFISPTIVQSSYSKLYLILWALSLLYPYLNAVDSNFWNNNGSYYRILSPFGGFMGYMILGYYLRYNVNTIRGTSLWCFICVFIAVLFPYIFYGGRFSGVQNGNIYDNLTINTAAMGSVYFLLIKVCFTNLNTKNIRKLSILSEISQKTFGIYLVHILIMRELLWPLWCTYFPNIGYVIQIPAVAIVTFILSYLIIKLISYIPGSKYIF